jgi:hypothetical protein
LHLSSTLFGDVFRMREAINEFLISGNANPLRLSQNPGPEAAWLRWRAASSEALATIPPSTAS